MQTPPKIPRSHGEWLYLKYVFLVTSLGFLIAAAQMTFGRDILVDGDRLIFRAKAGLSTFELSACLLTAGFLVLRLKKAFTHRSAIHLLASLGLIGLLAGFGYAFAYTHSLEVVLTRDYFIHRTLHSSIGFEWREADNLQANPLPWYSFGRSNTTQYPWLNFSMDDGRFGLHFPLVGFGDPPLLEREAGERWAAVHGLSPAWSNETP